MSRQAESAAERHKQLQKALRQAQNKSAEAAWIIQFAQGALARADNTAIDLHAKLSLLERAVDDVSASYAVPVSAAGYDFAGTSAVGTPALPTPEFRPASPGHAAAAAASLNKLLSAARSLSQSTASTTAATASSIGRGKPTVRPNPLRSIVVVPGVRRSREESGQLGGSLPVAVEAINDEDLPDVR